MIDKQLQAQLRKDLQDFMADRVEDIREADWQGVIIHEIYNPSNHDHTHLT